ncbi:hypothetical protein VPH35_074625 [Triticum aestivum]
MRPRACTASHQEEVPRPALPAVAVSASRHGRLPTPEINGDAGLHGSLSLSYPSLSRPLSLSRLRHRPRSPSRRRVFPSSPPSADLFICKRNASVTITGKRHRRPRCVAIIGRGGGCRLRSCFTQRSARRSVSSPSIGGMPDWHRAKLMKDDALWLALMI